MTKLAAVIPLGGKEVLAGDEPGDTDVPEPRALYCLTVIAFLLHIDVNGTCPRCREAWPCDHLRLAYRLREGF